MPVTTLVAPFQANSFAGGITAGNLDGQPTVLENGNVVLAWSQFGGSDWEIRTRVFEPDGTPVTGDIAVNVVTSGTQVRSNAVALGDGRFMVVWEDYSNINGDGSNSCVKGRIFNPDGSPATGEFLVNTTFYGPQDNEGAATLADGGAVISWYTGDGRDPSSIGVALRIYNADGTPRTSDILVNTTTIGSQFQIRVAALADGGFVAAFYDDSTGQVRGRVFDADGTPRSTTNNSPVGDTNDFPTGVFNAEPQVVGLANGGFAVTSYTGLIRLFDENGLPVGSVFSVSAGGAVAQTNITALRDGSFIAVWSGDGGAIELRHFNADGTPRTGDVTFGGFGNYPHINLVGGGDFVVTWQYGGNLYASVLRADITTASDDALATDENSDLTGSVFADNGNGLDTDPDGDTLTVVAVQGDAANVGATITLLSGAQIVINSDGSYSLLTAGLTDHLAAGASLSETITYTVVDTHGNRSTASVEITINGVNDAPTGAPTATLSNGTEDTSYTVSAADLLAGFSDVDGDTLAVANLTSSAGTITDNGDGTYTVTLPGDFNGSVTLTYDVSDGNGGVVEGQTRTFGVDAVNDAPTAMFLSGTSADEFVANGTVVGLLTHDDVDGGVSPSFTLLDDAGGRFVIVGNELRVANGLLLDYEQATSHEVEIEVSDGAGGTFVQTFVITVGNVDPEEVTGDGEVNRLVGGVLADTLAGGGGGDDLVGGGGGDTLIGNGGADRLTGGEGDDVYHADSLDTILELVGQGFDTVLAVGSVTLTTGAEIELLATLQPSGTTAITLVGNEFGQTIEGNAGNNTLIGGGGIDHFAGAAGNDIYVVDAAAETIVEVAGQGYDSVCAATSYTLATGVSVERLSTTAVSGTTVINLTGNEVAQVIVGNAANNRLSGGGGNDSLYGNHGHDWLEGGQGNDHLFGGAGVDRYLFRENASSGIDRIYDMTFVDNIVIDALAVHSFTQLSADQFRLGTAALDADDRVLYDQATGVFRFDPDGNGAQAAIVFGVVHGAPVVDHTWFELM